MDFLDLLIDMVAPHHKKKDRKGRHLRMPQRTHMVNNKERPPQNFYWQKI